MRTYVLLALVACALGVHLQDGIPTFIGGGRPGPKGAGGQPG